MSIRLRLTLWYTAILTVTLMLFGVLIYFLISTTTHRQYTDILETQTELVYDRIGYELILSLSGWDLDIQLDDIDSFSSKEIYLQIVNLTGTRDPSVVRVKRSSNAERNNLFIPFNEEMLEQARNKQTFVKTAHIQGYPFLIYNKPILIRGQLVGVLQSMVVTGEFLKDLRWIFITASLVTIVLASSLGWFMARKALSPIESMIAATERIEKGTDLDHRIQYEGPQDEIGRLTHKMNGMLDRIQKTYLELEEAYRLQRRFVSDASHELRTPLTTIRGNIDLLQKMWNQASLEHDHLSADSSSNHNQLMMSQESIQDIAEEAERMSRLVNNLLSLARADAGYEMIMEPLELRPIVDEVARKSQFFPRNADWRIGDLSRLDGLQVLGNADYLKQLLFIFIENAFKYTEQGYVEMTVLLEKDQVGICITDTGIGMKQQEIPYIFDRFYRLDESRGITPGTGLGLSIAKWIIDEHKGSISINSYEHQGTSFVIWLPVYFPEG